MTEGAALAGLLVVEWASGVAGPLAGMLLADHGAEVVKAEPSGGDPARADPGFHVWNRGKRGVAVTGPDGVAALLAGADLCIVSAPTGRLAGTPLEPAAVAGRHPRLVYLHTPPYTDDAPWAGGGESDALLGALTGTAMRQFSSGGGPVDDVYPHLVTVQGIWAAAAAVSALHERERSGCGQVVTVAGVHGVMVAAAGALTFDASAAAPAPTGPAGPVPYYRLYQCGDGEWLFLAALIPRFTACAFEALGVPDLLTDPRLGANPRGAMLTPEHAPWVTARLAGAFRARPRAEWLEILARAGCPVGPVLSRADWLDHPQLAATGMRVEVDDPVLGPVAMPGVPLTLTAAPGWVGGAAPPPPGPSEGPAAAPRPASPEPGAGPLGAADTGADARPDGPLAGVVVLDLGAIIAGPFAASLLAELGADVVKIEPLSGDSFRGPGFAAYNKGQRSVAVNLADERGRATFLRLVAGADVVIDNYRPGVLERLGIGYDALRAVNPGVIAISITGFGPGGPLGREAGFDPVLQAMSGMMAAQGGDDEPVFFTIPVNDVAAAATSALAACLALHHRTRHGGGQRVWTSLAAMATLLQAGELVRFPGRPASPVGGRDHRGPAPADRFVEVADGWVRVHARGNASGLFAGMSDALASMTRDTACRWLTERGIPAAPARRTAELAGDDALVSYGMLQPDPRPDRAGWWTTGRHVHMSRTPRTAVLTAPALGRHTVEVLSAAGLSPGEIDALLAAGVVKQATVS
ncbi:MAG TPA: CoA transferase [Acidimicrobiales bacterium]|nr:CoA transferase [Acidimicrobiales bacterium]